ncbi:Galactose-3-O-sulfotransferase, partial [Halocaridina rubra]
MPITMDTESLHKSFQGLDEQFDLVMIAERFDESLILLKHLMCWTTQDITNIKLNFRPRNRNETASQKTKMKLRKQNYYDAMLYDYFSGIFNHKVNEFGKERMQKEVYELRQANRELLNKCVFKELVEWDAEANSRWENRK